MNLTSVSFVLWWEGCVALQEFMLKSEINTETAGKCESSIVCRLWLMYCICIIGNWKILASIFGGHFSGTPSVHLKTPKLQGKCPCSWLGPSIVLLHPWTPSSLSDLGGKPFLELVMIAGSYLPGESFQSYSRWPPPRNSFQLFWWGSWMSDSKR